MVDPDEDYENPIGEVLDEDTVSDLARAHLAYSLLGILRMGPNSWPFI
ncbi:hypothetical protein SEQ_HALENA_69 [Mycobacterium phage Halena]|uniref:Uncharacterized protein n=8 Tax=Bronvirus TaxID=1623278 RepID=E0YPK3_9CAUD|nr:hypothetical protein LEBRON_70 [Mycobacterium phage LeBron]YP_009635916.1 hypothetical protein FGG55_gp071 [Mycobacterium phage JoeDirt]YP_010101376.1 hypothetical protein KNU48_gp089 [Mycobacterium phage Silverleaf]YP_010105470.1 hypothetical protein KNU85_gp068 [Mycobacterium phage DirkDirk]YP_010114769.1 hypothetical protein KNV76_gp069 [Mycobacterium phage OhShagHennessy]AEK07604.1 hypothetical protein UPIE_70 [Mycobacterium phage UPIE]AEZ50748.1 hypothetical protein [Mycobacterium pha